MGRELYFLCRYGASARFKRATLATHLTNTNNSTCQMATLYALIQDPAQVARAVAAMGNPYSVYEKIELYDFSLASAPRHWRFFYALSLTPPPQ